MPFETIISGTEEQKIITLRDLTNNTFSEIYADGALLNKFCVLDNNEFLNVIEGFASPDEAKERITYYFKSAKMSPYACRVKNASYTFGNDTYHLSKFFAQEDAIHGLLYNAPFSIIEQKFDDISASVRLEYIYDNTSEGYPFCYKCEVEYKLSSDSNLSITTKVTNLDHQLMPVMDGWHPYFTLGDSIDGYQLEFQSKEMLDFENLIPTGKLIPFQEFGSLKNLEQTVLDNCFTLNFAECQPLCILRNPSRKIQVEIYPSPSYPYLQIFTPPRRSSIAIENLSAAPDAFNNGIGLKVLEPNETIVFSTAYRIKSI